MADASSCAGRRKSSSAATAGDRAQRSKVRPCMALTQPAEPRWGHQSRSRRQCQKHRQETCRAGHRGRGHDAACTAGDHSRPRAFPQAPPHQVAASSGAQRADSQHSTTGCSLEGDSHAGQLCPDEGGGAGKVVQKLRRLHRGPQRSGKPAVRQGCQMGGDGSWCLAGAARLLASSGGRLPARTNCEVQSCDPASKAWWSGGRQANRCGPTSPGAGGGGCPPSMAAGRWLW